MNQKSRGWQTKIRHLSRGFLLGLLGLILFANPLHAQEIDAAPPQLFVTGYDVASPPQVVLTAFGRDGDGGVLDLSQETFLLRHGGRPWGMLPSLSPDKKQWGLSPFFSSIFRRALPTNFPSFRM